MGTVSGSGKRVGVGVVIVVVIGLLGFLQFHHSDSGTVLQRAKKLEASRDATSVVLRSQDGSLHARIVTNNKGRGYLYGDNLAPLPKDRSYQVWAMNKDKPISMGHLSGHMDAVQLDVPKGAHVFAVTDEPAKGSGAPTQSPIVLGSF